MLHVHTTFTDTKVISSRTVFLLGIRTESILAFLGTSRCRSVPAVPPRHHVLGSIRVYDAVHARMAVDVVGERNQRQVAPRSHIVGNKLANSNVGVLHWHLEAYDMIKSWYMEAVRESNW